MNPSDVAPMVVVVTITVVTGAVMLLRPIAKRLGDLLEVMVAERRRPAPAIEPRLQETLERIEERLRLIEERQDFTDALIAHDDRARLAAGQERGPAPKSRPPATRGEHAGSDPS